MNLRSWMDKARQSAEELRKKVPLPKRGGDIAPEEILPVTEADDPTPVPLATFEVEPVGSPCRPYVAISRVGSIRAKIPHHVLPLSPDPVPFAVEQPRSGTPYMGTAQMGSAAVRAPVPSAIRNMHRFALTPLASKPAEFVVSEMPGADSGVELDLGDDLFSLVARTINLKLRRSPAPPSSGPPEEASEVTHEEKPSVDAQETGIAPAPEGEE